MNDTKQENINPKLVVSRPAVKRHVRGASVTPSLGYTIVLNVCYTLSGAVVAGIVAHLLVSYVGQ